MNNLNFEKLDVFKNDEEIKLNFDLKKILINYLVSESSYLTNTITKINKEYEKNNEKRKKKFYKEISKKENYENNFESFVNIEIIKENILKGFIRNRDFVDIYINNSIINKSNFNNKDNEEKFKILDNIFNNLNKNKKIMMYIILTEIFYNIYALFFYEDIAKLYVPVGEHVLKNYKIKEPNKKHIDIKISNNFNEVKISENQIFFYYICEDFNNIIPIYNITYTIEIDFGKNKYELIYKCHWEKKCYIDFYYFSKLYKYYFKNLNNIIFLIKNNIDDYSMIKLFNFLVHIIKIIEKNIKNNNKNNIFLKILENIKNNIDKNKNFDSIIIDLIKDIDLFILIKSNDKLFDIINKNISKKTLNEIYQIIPKNINKSEDNKSENNKSENNKKIDNDFLIINYNEDNKEFNNINNIILKIFFENPSFVIISTQNCNKKEKTQYQYILGTFLKKNGYVKLVKNNNIKTLSTIIYYNEKKVIFNIKKSSYLNKITSIFRNTGKKENKSNELLNLKNSEYYKRATGIKQNKYYIKSYEIKEKNDIKYGPTGVIFIILEISFINDSIHKFIFINCNFLNNSGPEFENIVNDFELIKYYKKYYNIFFCGNFNFNFTVQNNNKKKLFYNDKNIYEDIQMNTLYLFLKKIITSHNLYKDAKKTQNVYNIIEQENNQKKVNNIYKTQKIFSEYNKEIKTNNTVKITFYINLLGSINRLGILNQSNRILYVLSGVSGIINFDFNIYSFPDKLTTLSFDIDKAGKNIKLEKVLRINNTT